jgi:hypothetical protein
MKVLAYICKYVTSKLTLEAQEIRRKALDEMTKGRR